MPRVEPPRPTIRLMTKAISDFILEHQSEILAYFALHSFAQQWMVPYGYAEGVKPPDYEELLRVAKIGAAALMAVNNQEWEVGNGADILYPCAGSSDDWAKAKAGIKYAYTLELRPADPRPLNAFFSPESEIDPSGRELFAGLAAAIEAMTP